MAVERELTDADIIEHVLGVTHLPLAVSGWGVLDLDVAAQPWLGGSTHSEVEVRALEHEELDGDEVSKG